MKLFSSPYIAFYFCFGTNNLNIVIEPSYESAYSVLALSLLTREARVSPSRYTHGYHHSRYRTKSKAGRQDPLLKETIYESTLSYSPYPPPRAIQYRQHHRSNSQGQHSDDI